MAEIIEFGGIRLDDDFREIDRLRVYVKPYSPIPKKITELTHITNDMVADAENMFKALPGIRGYIGDSVPVGHNSRFDVTFLSTLCLKMELPVLTDYIDTMACYRAYRKSQGDKLGKGEANLSSCCEHFNIDLVNAHSAIADADATAKLFCKMHEVCPDALTPIFNSEQNCFETCMSQLCRHNPTKKMREMLCDYNHDNDGTPPDVDTAIAAFESGETPISVSRRLGYDFRDTCAVFARWLTPTKMPRFVCFESRPVNRQMRQMIRHCDDFEGLMKLHERLYGVEPGHMNIAVYWYFNRKYSALYGKVSPYERKKYDE